MINILEYIGIGFKNKITLYKTSSTVELWWEDKSKAFLNIKYKDDKGSHWVINKDVDGHIKKFRSYKIKETF